MDGTTLTAYPTVTTYPANQIVEVTAVPAPGYRFIGWSGNETSMAETVMVAMTCTKNITANFEPIRYRVFTIITPSSSGSIEIEPTQPMGGYVRGTRVTLTAKPAAGYFLQSWSGSLSGSVTPLSLTIDSEKTITAIFVLSNQDTRQLTLDANPVEGGTIKMDAEIITTFPAVVTHSFNDRVSLTAVPLAGYRFTGWSGSIQSNESNITVSMNDAKNITANFELVRYQLTITNNPVAGGTVTLDPPTPAGGYVTGTTVTLTALPKDGHVFKGWTGISGGHTLITTLIVNSDQAISANFSKKPLPAWAWISICSATAAIIIIIVIFVRQRKP